VAAIAWKIKRLTYEFRAEPVPAFSRVNNAIPLSRTMPKDIPGGDEATFRHCRKQTESFAF